MTLLSFILQVVLITIIVYKFIVYYYIMPSNVVYTFSIQYRYILDRDLDNPPKLLVRQNFTA